jgi:hypothetical protein
MTRGGVLTVILSEAKNLMVPAKMMGFFGYRLRMTEKTQNDR